MYCIIALLVFDTLLTLPSEIKYIWCKKFRLGIFLYFLARYSLLATSLVYIYVSLFVVPLQVCEFKAVVLHFCS